MPRRRKLTIVNEAHFWLLMESGQVPTSTIAAILDKSLSETYELYTAFVQRHGRAAAAVNQEKYAGLEIRKVEK